MALPNELGTGKGHPRLRLRGPALGMLLLAALPIAAPTGPGSPGESGEQTAEDRRPEVPDVVVIVLDTARPDFLSAYGHPRPTTPFLERLAAEGARFDRAYSSSSWTLPAHATLFTGEPPRVHQANQNHQAVGDGLPLLAEELSAKGYRTAGFSGNAWVAARSGLDRGFEHFEEIAGSFYVERTRERAKDREGRREPPEQHYIVERVRTWLDSARSDPRPLFLFVNLVEPHMPYLPDAQAAAPFVSAPDERWQAIQSFYPEADCRVVSFRHYAREDPLDECEWALLKSMYEGALRAADELAGAIVGAVDAARDGGEPLVFVLSDHGENLGDHGHFQHMFNLYDSNVRIALLARGPGFRPGRVEENVVQIADLHGTILSAAGLGANRRAGTLDLRLSVPGDRVVTAELGVPRVSLSMFPADVRESGGMQAYARSLFAAVGPRYKLIRASTGTEELYDLALDPGERNPLSADEIEPAALARLEEALARLAAMRPASPAPIEPKPLEEETRVALRAMGYVGE